MTELDGIADYNPFPLFLYMESEDSVFVFSNPIFLIRGVLVLIFGKHNILSYELKCLLYEFPFVFYYESFTLEKTLWSPNL